VVFLRKVEFKAVPTFFVKVEFKPLFSLLAVRAAAVPVVDYLVTPIPVRVLDPALAVAEPVVRSLIPTRDDEPDRVMPGFDSLSSFLTPSRPDDGSRLSPGVVGSSVFFFKVEFNIVERVFLFKD